MRAGKKTGDRKGVLKQEQEIADAAAERKEAASKGVCQGGPIRRAYIKDRTPG